MSLAAAVCMLLNGSVLTAQSPETKAAKTKLEENEQLRLVVILSRHGVRSPTWTPERLNAYSVRPWPAWTVPPGYLTPHGYALLKDFGAQDRRQLAAQGLFAAGGCHDAASVFVYADTDERTLESGKALAEGVFPGCGVELHSQAGGGDDAIFHAPAPVGADLARDRSAALAELQARLERGDAAQAPELEAALQRVLLGCATEGACAPAHPPASTISTEPLGAVAGQGEHLVELTGGLPTASTLSEDLLLEYGDAMSADKVGWGHVNEAQLRHLLAVHTLYFDLIHRTPALARAENSGLLSEIDALLRQRVEGHAVQGALGRPEQKLAVLVGHDTNLAGIASLLGLHWSLDGRVDDTPPGTELAFSLWQKHDGTFEVRVGVAMQTLEQMHGTGGKPVEQAVTVSGCSTHDGCDWASFERVVRLALGGQ